jgi:hypothetical protein
MLVKNCGEVAEGMASVCGRAPTGTVDVVDAGVEVVDVLPVTSARVFDPSWLVLPPVVAIVTATATMATATVIVVARRLCRRRIIESA